MGLADKLEEHRPDDRHPFERQFDQLNDEDKAALMAAVRDPAWSNARLRGVLVAEGFHISKEAFANWRKNVTG